MMKISDYLYEINDCGINLEKLKRSCEIINNEILNIKPTENLDKAYKQKDAPVTTQLASFYNFFTFPFPEVHTLFKAIQKNFYEVERLHYGKNLSQNYFLYAWLNYYNKNEFVNWHTHQGAARSWHGFFCVETVPSFTHYMKISNPTDVVSVENSNNTLIIGLSEDNLHKTDPWEDTARPRITIAFEIVGENFLKIKRNIAVPI